MSAARVKDSSASLDPAAFEQVHTIRGVTYTFRELEIGEWDDLVLKATSTKKVNGVEVEETDNTLLLKLMVMSSCTSPRLTVPGLAKLRMPVALRINRIVNDMHYELTPDDPKKDKDGEETQEGDDEAGNG